MTALINASTSSGVVVTSDTSGSLAFQSNGTTIMTVASTGVSTQVGAPAFSVYNSNAQTISTGTYTKIQFNTKNFDTANAYDNVTNYRFTPTVAGYYFITGQVGYNTSVTAPQCVIYKNGAGFKNGNNFGSGNWATATALIYLNGSTDYVEFTAYTANTTNQTVHGSIQGTYFVASLYAYGPQGYQGTTGSQGSQGNQPVQHIQRMQPIQPVSLPTLIAAPAAAGAHVPTTAACALPPGEPA